MTSSMTYERFMKGKQIFHTAEYKRPSKSDATFVQTDSGCYKRIEKITSLKEENSWMPHFFCRPVIADTPAVPPHIRECFLSHDRQSSRCGATKRDD